MMTEVLKKLGFSEKQIRVYLASLELGPSTVQKIAQKAHLPRSSTYLLIEELKNKGLLSQTKLGKKTILTPSSPDRLINLAKEKRKKAEKTFTSLKALLPQLWAIYNQQPKKPNVFFYQGFEGIKTILEETLKEKEILVLCSGYQQPIEKKLNQYLNEYFKKVIKKGIKTFEIIGQSPDSKEYQKTYSTPRNKIRIVSFPKNLEHIDKLIFANKLAIISYVYLNGVIIENKQIADYERTLFWQLWLSIPGIGQVET